MRIAVICESSSADKNKDIVAAIDGLGHQIINIGMKSSDEENKLLYTHTGVITGLLLNCDIADYVISGCGTGQGFTQAAMQFPGVFCGHILTPLDAWLFTQINGGNCISLSLNQGYGWAADINLRFIFEKLFSVESGSGYPKHRKLPQAEAREELHTISDITHREFIDILRDLPVSVMEPVLKYPGIENLLLNSSIKRKMPDIWKVLDNFLQLISD